MPSDTGRDRVPQHPFLSAVRESQAAILDAVDRAFDLAEQTLAAQRQFALTLVGVADRQVDTVVETVESTAREAIQQTEELLEADVAQPAAEPAEEEQPKPRKANGRQASRTDRRPFEERSLEELRERARELDIEGRSAMSKDELVAALRKQGK